MGDAPDLKIVSLKDHAARPNAEIADCLERLKKLNDDGQISGFACSVNMKSNGYPISFLIVGPGWVTLLGALHEVAYRLAKQINDNSEPIDDNPV